MFPPLTGIKINCNYYLLATNEVNAKLLLEMTKSYSGAAAKKKERSKLEKFELKSSDKTSPALSRK